MQKVDYTFEQIVDKVNEALNEFYTEDSDLLDRDVNERSITHRFAVYLEQFFPEWDYHIDCEYNRNYREPKYLGLEPEDIKFLNNNLQSNDTEARTVYPDIIIHRRNYNDQNLLVIEAKKEKPSTKAESLDIRKLRAFTNLTDGNPYKYQWGLHVIFEKDSPRLKWFENGE